MVVERAKLNDNTSNVKVDSYFNTTEAKNHYDKKPLDRLIVSLAKILKNDTYSEDLHGALRQNIRERSVEKLDSYKNSGVLGKIKQVCSAIKNLFQNFEFKSYAAWGRDLANKIPDQTDNQIEVKEQEENPVITADDKDSENAESTEYSEASTENTSSHESSVTTPRSATHSESLEDIGELDEDDGELYFDAESVPSEEFEEDSANIYDEAAETTSSSDSSTDSDYTKSVTVSTKSSEELSSSIDDQSERTTSSSESSVDSEHTDVSADATSENSPRQVSTRSVDDENTITAKKIPAKRAMADAILAVDQESGALALSLLLNILKEVNIVKWEPVAGYENRYIITVDEEKKGSHAEHSFGKILLPKQLCIDLTKDKGCLRMTFPKKGQQLQASISGFNIPLSEITIDPKESTAFLKGDIPWIARQALKVFKVTPSATWDYGYVQQLFGEMEWR